MHNGQRFIAELPRSTPVKAETEVLVIGGGSAGVSAAVAAARNGADVILVERLGYLGGLATGGLIILLLTLDDGRGRQVIGGLCQEVIDRVAKRGAAYCPPKTEWGSEEEALVRRDQRWGLVWGHGPHRVRYSVAYDPEEFKFALNQMTEEARVHLLLHAYACDALVEDNRLTGVTFHSKSGRFAILAKVVIDASGDGDIFTSAGAAYEKEEVLPWLWFCMGGVENAEAAIKAGDWFFHTIGEGKVLLPWGATERVTRKIDATSPEDLTYAELECRKQVMAEVDRLRCETPGFAKAHLCHIADQLGVTESRRLVGEYMLGRDDIDKPCNDVIALTGHWTKYEALYYIPYRSLLTKEFANLLVAGRCISVDHRVHHATKEIPPCMATGEAAGTAAALAVRAEIEPKSVDVKLVQRRLEERGAILHV
ncbi:MAG TPA: FAD-dependent oxidoreductase [Candidatus Binatia bacterium]|nr:FAD-dependent oxidoreductase [Candidatus Binatia bacterium]